MNIRLHFSACLILLPCLAASGATTIDPANHLAYAANGGWVEAGDPVNGAVIGRAFCSGSLFAANLGWIDLGDGTPDNGYAYRNIDGADFGVNHDGEGGLSGLAYGANIGWLVFEQAIGRPRVDLLTGNLSGQVWCPNIGWIDLATTPARVRTAWLEPGPDTDFDNLPDAWEYFWIGNLVDLGFGDWDGDGRTDFAEYEANTNPFDGSNFMRIVFFGQISGIEALLWETSPGRIYMIEGSFDLDPGTAWDFVDGPYVSSEYGTLSAVFRPSYVSPRFYRVAAYLPLSP